MATTNTSLDCVELIQGISKLSEADKTKFFDRNNDNLFDANDTLYNTLKVWTDTNVVRNISKRREQQYKSVWKNLIMTIRK